MRSDFVRMIGVAHSALDAGDHGEPLAFAVRRINIEFHRPAKIDDLVEVETLVKELRGASILLNQIIRRGTAAMSQPRSPGSGPG